MAGTAQRNRAGRDAGGGSSGSSDSRWAAQRVDLALLVAGEPHQREGLLHRALDFGARQPLHLEAEREIIRASSLSKVAIRRRS